METNPVFETLCSLVFFSLEYQTLD
jgi:hypothetical protein